MSTPNPPIIISKGSGIISRSSSVRIPGTFSSTFRYGEQVVSTGVSSLDSFIGGGIPLGCVCIIKDVFPSRYADCVLKSFIAEGASYNHHIFVASGRENCQEYLVNELPSLVSSSSKQSDKNIKDDAGGDNNETMNIMNPSNMKIAWRYGHQQQRGVGGTTGGGKEITKFDFTKKSSAADLGAKHVTISKIVQDNYDSLNDPTCKDLLQEIVAVVNDFKLPLSTAAHNSTPATGVQVKFPTNLVRIGLSHCEEQVLSPKFMLGLKAITRHTNSCALITISEMASPTTKIGRCEHFADYVISLQAVTDEKRRTDLGDIDGICDVLKISSLNSLKPVDLPRDLGFSFKKKRLVFHELNLPPEGESTAQREASNNTYFSTSTGACGGTTIKGKSIEF